jgi:hypothetical protein
MPPIKKKINANTVANTEAKSIDSFFASVVVQNTADNEDASLVKPLVNTINILDAKKSILEDENKEELTKEIILKKLTQHKILFSHIEIKNKVDNLSENEVTEIFKIIKNNNEKYSTNKNGIFINLSTLKKNTIQEICNFLYFCDNNNRAIDEEELERAKYKDIIYDN